MGWHLASGPFVFGRLALQVGLLGTQRLLVAAGDADQAIQLGQLALKGAIDYNGISFGYRF
ncbi:hypothetical protein D3C86_2092830 [compost metagenome]